MVRRLLIFCMAVLLIGTVAVSAAEFDPDQTGAISVTLREQQKQDPIAGAELQLYHVATVRINTAGQLNYFYTKPFAETGLPLDTPELARLLDTYVSGKTVPSVTQVTGEDGSAVWKELPLGLYFIRQANTVEGFAPCTPFFVTVPTSAAGYEYAVNASPKTEVAKLTDITIRKVWNTDASTKATDSVTVELLRDGAVVETAVLKEENGWQVTYSNLPESDAYSIREVAVPQGFTATYKQKGYVFTVTNTSTLIQTGQVIWPIPVLAIVGVLLLTVGALLQKRKQDA